MTGHVAFTGSLSEICQGSKNTEFTDILTSAFHQIEMDTEDRQTHPHTPLDLENLNVGKSSKETHDTIVKPHTIFST